MKRIPVLLFFILSAVFTYGQVVTITIESIPENIDEFIELRSELAVTPEGGAAMFALAMLVLEQDSDFAMQCFTVMLANDGTMLKDDPGGYKGYSPGNASMYHIDRLIERPWVSRSYVFGTSPSDNYRLETLPYEFKFIRNKYSEIEPDLIKVFIDCSGAGTPRPVTMQENNRGIWKVKEFSSLSVGVRESKIIDDDL